MKLQKKTVQHSKLQVVTDHLGNVRVTFSNGRILSKAHYYPFGMLIGDISQNNTNPQNNYLYNAKELQSDFGLDWYDYGARFYDPQIGRWHVADPLAEKRSWLSPYQYAQNNPIMRIDTNGMLDDWWKNDETGNAEYIEEKKIWDQQEMADKGYSYLGEYQLSDNVYLNTPEIFNYGQDAWSGGISIDGEQYGNDNLGGRAGSMEGHADGANTGTLAKEDVIVGTDIVSDMVGAAFPAIGIGKALYSILADSNPVEDIVNSSFQSGDEDIVDHTSGILGLYGSAGEAMAGTVATNQSELITSSTASTHSRAVVYRQATTTATAFQLFGIGATIFSVSKTAINAVQKHNEK